MKFVVSCLLTVLALALVLSRNSSSVVPPVASLRGIPISMIANGKPQPRIGLVAPMPNWIPLPEKGFVTGAEIFPPQPPYGPAAVVMLRYEETSGEFVENYRYRLERAGFAVRRVPSVFHLIVDRPDAQYEADEKNGGHVAYITLRHGYGLRLAQLTFWASPAPRM